MPVKAIGVPGAGTIIIENAAEESTMRQILAAINKQGGVIPKGGEAPKAGVGGTTEDKSTEINNDRMKRGADAEARFQEVIKGTSEVFQNSAKDFSRTFSNDSPTIRNFSGLLASYSPEPFSTAMAEFGGTMGDQVEIFRQLSQSGIDLGDSLLQAQLSAGQARLPLEIFGKTVKENSQMLSMAFGGATNGALKFAETQGKFMAQSGQKFASLGFSMDELATYNASYMDQMQRSGRLSKMSTDEIVAGQERYNMELDKLSKATGLSRQQIDEANKAAQRDARMKLALGKLDSDQQAAVNAKIKQLEQLDPTGKMAAGFKDLIAGGGVALTAESRQFTLAMQSAGVDASKIGRDIFSGSKDAVANMNAGFSKAAKASEGITEGERRTAAAMATMGRETPALGKAVLQGMGDSAKAIENARAEQEKKLASKDPTRGAAGIDQTLTEVQNSFKRSIIETRVFDLTATGLQNATAQAEKLADGFANLNTTQKMAAVIGVEAAKKAGSALLEAAVGGAGGYYGAKKAGMAWDEYQARKEGKIKPTEPVGTKVPGAAAGEAAEKTLGSRAAEAVSKMAKKVGMAIVGIGGTYYLVKEFDLAGMSIDGILGGSNKQPERLSLEEERRRDKVPGAELPKSAESNAAKPQAPAEVSADNATQVAKLNQEVNALKTALKDVDYSKLMFPEAIGTSIDSGIIKLKNLRDEITTTTSSFKDFNNVNLENLSSNINKLGEAIKEVNKPKEGANAPTTLGFNDSNKQVVELLNQLNTNMGALASMQGDAVDYLSKTAKYTRQASNNTV